MAVVWEKFYHYVQPYLPGCPEIVIEAHLKEAAADFFARSEIWRFDIEPDFTSASTKDYELDTPTNAVLENIYELLLDDQCLTRISDRHVNISRFTTNGKPIYYAVYQDTSVRFYPTPDKKYDQSQKPELDKQIGMLKGRLRQQSQTPATNVLPADKTAKIQQAIKAGKLNKDQYALAGRSIMKYRDQGFDVKQLVVAWLATGKSNLMQSKELEELKLLAGIK